MEEIKLRKYEHALVISGVGVIAFGIWSIIKAAIYFILVPLDELGDVQPDEGLAVLQAMGMTDRGIGYVIAVTVLFVLLLDFVLRLYIGRAAVIDGRRLKKKRFIYVILAMFVAISTISSLVTRGVQLGAGGDTAWGGAVQAANVSVIVDLTSLLAVIEMIVAAIMVRRLRKALRSSRTEGE